MSLFLTTQGIENACWKRQERATVQIERKARVDREKARVWEAIKCFADALLPLKLLKLTVSGCVLQRDHPTLLPPALWLVYRLIGEWFLTWFCPSRHEQILFSSLIILPSDIAKPFLQWPCLKASEIVNKYHRVSQSFFSSLPHLCFHPCFHTTFLAFIDVCESDMACVSDCSSEKCLAAEDLCSLIRLCVYKKNKTNDGENSLLW